MLYTRSIYDEVREDDGIRISVMCRHTLPDGITPDPRLTKAIYTLHWPILAPSPRLLGDYYRRGLAWEAFSARYLTEMKSPVPNMYVVRLATLACVADVTILCVESDPASCHRSLLAQLCQRAQCHLKVQHR